MRWRFVLYVVGILVACLGILMTLPLGVALIYRGGDVGPLLQSIAWTVLGGGALALIFRSPDAGHISQREGMGIVALGWTAVGLFGALPFHLSGEFVSFTDAAFESISGFTTTGSSILTNIEGLSRGLLFWRSLIQWLGGMGIIVLSLAILPFLGVGGMQLYKAEVPSPVPDKLKPRIRDTAMILWKVYVLFTVVETALLMFGGMSLYDAVCHAFTTMPTGGFSTRNGSVTDFNSLYIDIVIIVFMVLAGINFSLHYQLIRGRPLAFWRDSECRFFLGAVILLTAVVAYDILGTAYETVGSAVRYAAFQVVSLITTTGYATADYETWPAMSQVILSVVHVRGGLGRVHRRGDEVPPDHALRQVLLQGALRPDPPPGRNPREDRWKSGSRRGDAGYPGFFGPLHASVCPQRGGTGRAGGGFRDRLRRGGGHHQQHRAGIRDGGAGGKLRSPPGGGEMAPRLVHAPGPAGDLHGDHPPGSGLLAEVGQFSP